MYYSVESISKYTTHFSIAERAVSRRTNASSKFTILRQLVLPLSTFGEQCYMFMIFCSGKITKSYLSSVIKVRADIYKIIGK